MSRSIAATSASASIGCCCVISSHIPGVTRNRLQRLIDAGAVTVNGRPVRRASARVAAGDALASTLPERQPRHGRSSPRPCRSTSVYEDDDLLIVNKPPGQVSHPAFRNTARHAAERACSPMPADAGCRRSSAGSTKTRPAWCSSPRRRDDARGVAAARAQQRHRQGLSRHRRRQAAGGRARSIWRSTAIRGTRRRVTVRDRGGVPSVTQFKRLAICHRPERYLSLVALPADHRPHASDSRAPGGEGLADRRRRDLRREIRAASQRQALHAWRWRFAIRRAMSRIDVPRRRPQDMAALLRAVRASGRPAAHR